MNHEMNACVKLSIHKKLILFVNLKIKQNHL